MDFSLPMEMGVTVEGNSTAFLRARTGSMSGSSLSFSFWTVSMLTTGTMFTSPVPALNKFSIVCFMTVLLYDIVSRAEMQVPIWQTAVLLTVSVRLMM